MIFITRSVSSHVSKQNYHTVFSNRKYPLTKVYFAIFIQKTSGYWLKTRTMKNNFTSYKNMFPVCNLGIKINVLVFAILNKSYQVITVCSKLLLAFINYPKRIATITTT